MYFLIFITILIVVYIQSFKDDFTKENFDKVSPVLVVLLGFIFIVTILSCVL